MSVDYNNFAKTFSKSRKNMKWEEIDYFISFLTSPQPSSLNESEFSILDIGCGNGRFLKFLKTSPLAPLLLGEGRYLGVDLSKGLLEEAKKEHPENDFLNLNMLDIDKISSSYKGEVSKGGWGYIFFIASFHHLDNLEDRLNVLKKVYNLLEDGGKIFMTNWALNSELNKEKYKDSIIPSPNRRGLGGGLEFGSLDYQIKIGEFDRYYHCFDLSELEYLFKEVGFEIIENRLFDNKRNFVSIIQKKGD